ncbi:hypothetical protein M3640_19365, partial [Bacillus velezensis]|nr:hypothetical protein [Bacillus velezensis]
MPSRRSSAEAASPAIPPPTIATSSTRSPSASRVEQRLDGRRARLAGRRRDAERERDVDVERACDDAVHRQRDARGRIDDADPDARARGHHRIQRRVGFDEHARIDARGRERRIDPLAQPVPVRDRHDAVPREVAQCDARFRRERIVGRQHGDARRLRDPVHVEP